MDMKQPLLVMFLGVPRSGKTYFATRLAKKIGGVRLNGDAMRLAIFGSLEAIEQTYHSEHRQHVNTYTFGAIDYVVEQLLDSGVSVIYDAIHSKRAERREHEELANRYGVVPVVVVMKTPHHVALQRGQDRAPTASDRQFDKDRMREAIEHFSNTMEQPEPTEHVVEINGEDSFEVQYQSFISQVNAIMCSR